MTAPRVASPSVTFDQIGTVQRFFDMVSGALAQAGGATDARGGPLVHALGVNELQAADSWPRIIWVPSSDTYTQQGATAFDLGGRMVKPVYVRLAGVTIWFHGRDFQMVEAMVNDYVSALHGLASTSVVIQNGRWANQEDDPQWTTDGQAYALAVAFAVPVVKVQHFTNIVAIISACGCEECDTPGQGMNPTPVVGGG